MHQCANFLPLLSKVFCRITGLRHLSQDVSTFLMLWNWKAHENLVPANWEFPKKGAAFWSGVHATNSAWFCVPKKLAMRCLNTLVFELLWQATNFFSPKFLMHVSIVKYAYFIFILTNSLTNMANTNRIYQVNTTRIWQRIWNMFDNTFGKWFVFGKSNDLYFVKPAFYQIWEYAFFQIKFCICQTIFVEPLVKCQINWTFQKKIWNVFLQSHSFN